MLQVVLLHPTAQQETRCVSTEYVALNVLATMAAIQITIPFNAPISFALLRERLAISVRIKIIRDSVGMALVHACKFLLLSSLFPLLVSRSKFPPPLKDSVSVPPVEQLLPF